jgi:PPOX class probable F420-dependent enzyme
MELNRAARDLIGHGANATIVTLNPSGTPHVSVVWVALDSTSRGDEILMGHLDEHIKVRNVRHNRHVVLSIVDPNPNHWEGPVRPYLKLTGTATIEEGDVHEFLANLSKHVGKPAFNWPPPDAPAGYFLRIHIDKVGGTGPWTEKTQFNPGTVWKRQRH